MISQNQIIISCIFNGINTLLFIYYIYQIFINPIDLLHITRWSYFFNSIFTTICLFCDIIRFISQENKDKIEAQMNYNLMDSEKNSFNLINSVEKLNEWNRNKYGTVVNSLGYFILIGFWSLFFMGNNLMRISKSIKNVFNCIYHHAIIQSITLIDLYTFERKTQNFSWIYFGIIYSIFAFYCLVIYLEKFYFMRDAYYFMDGASPFFLAMCMIISSFILFGSYLLHIYLIELKNKKTEKKIHSNDDKEQPLLEEGRI